MIIETVTAGPFQSNAFVVACPETKRGVIIDTGTDGAGIEAAVRRRDIEVEAILLTHGHVDHVGGVARLKRVWDVPTYLHPLDLPLIQGAPMIGRMFGVQVEPVPDPDKALEAGDVLEVGSLRFDVIFVPGHAPGHVAFVTSERVFSGDVLFQGSIGRTDLPGGDLETLLASIRNELFPLGDEIIVHCGHGPDTTIGHERRTNPFLKQPLSEGL